ncbi:MAG: hypothetical protein JWO09_871 [Bacteroidetes bacterium]|nr:hypothetical protein [Bacteroidota bacterium]
MTDTNDIGNFSSAGILVTLQEVSEMNKLTGIYLFDITDIEDARYLVDAYEERFKQFKKTKEHPSKEEYLNGRATFLWDFVCYCLAN